MATRKSVRARKAARPLPSRRHPEARGAQRRASKGDGPCPSSFAGGLQPPPQDDGAGQSAAPAPAPKPRNAKPVRAIESRRIQMTPALYDNMRHRFEHSSEGLHVLAADLGCTAETVRNLANREGWVRYVPPPRDLSPAAKLAAKAQAAAADRERATTATPTPIPSPQGGGEEIAAAPQTPFVPAHSPPEATDAPPQIADTAQALHRELLQLLADVTAERARMKREGYGRHDLREMSGTIASLGAVLRAVQSMLGAAPQRDGDHHDDIADDLPDDLPDDIDACRDEFARRIRAFVESRTGGGGDAGGNAAPPVDESGA